MTPNIFPVLRYRDGHAAIEWLRRAFGFDTHVVHDAPDGTLAHAELQLDAGVVMVGSTAPSQAGNPWSAVRQGLYVSVADIDALHDRAKAAGADIASPLKDQEYGSREFAPRDLDGHLWGFGTYAIPVTGEPNIYPGLHYRDSSAALAWLARAFGFTPSVQVPGPDGTIVHAEAKLDAGTIFVESGPRDPATWGESAQATYVRVADVDVHHARGVGAGANIIAAPHDTPWGRSYYVHDLDRFVWGFTTYKPA